MFRTILLSSAALAALTTASFAADLPNRKEAPVAPYIAAPIFTWTGFYVGGQIGAGWLNNTDTDTFANVPFGKYKQNSSGVVGGLFAGYNWQMSNALVVGLEADIEATSLSAKSSTEVFVAGGTGLSGTASTSLPWQGSLRARLGYAAGNALFYVTGGLAVAQFNNKYLTIATGVSDSFSSTQAGWTLGAGIEYAFNPNWTVRAEYRYSQFAGYNNKAVAVGNTWFNGATEVQKNRPSENAVRVGIAYKFGAPASAVVAKY